MDRRAFFWSAMRAAIAALFSFGRPVSTETPTHVVRCGRVSYDGHSWVPLDPNAYECPLPSRPGRPRLPIP